jgi:hypothetical protein
MGAGISGIGADVVVAVPAALQPPTDDLRDAVPLFIRPARHCVRHGYQSSGTAVKRASAASKLSWK